MLENSSAFWVRVFRSLKFFRVCAIRNPSAIISEYTRVRFVIANGESALSDKLNHQIDYVSFDSTVDDVNEFYEFSHLPHSSRVDIYEYINETVKITTKCNSS